MSKTLYTKIFLKQADIAISPPTLKLYTQKWWQNTREKNEGGMRLTEEGFDFLKNQIDLRFYEIPLPRKLKLTTQTIIFLDQFITCPYFLEQSSIFVTDEKKSMELHLFSGDLEKYGLTKAMGRYD
jgi:hypothetical protein